MSKKVRVRFAPSPTGGLHVGGVRTVLFNYLFARQQGGDFILRIEDTDQSRYVPGAEEYIMQCLQWCNLLPDEGPDNGGAYAPYRQSERKDIYQQYAQQLIQQGHAYYAFDTPEELEEMRTKFKTDENTQPQYNHQLRGQMRNSYTLPEAEVTRLIAAGTPYVIRIKVPADAEVKLQDMIRGEVSFHTSDVDDKVLLKADGMPTYHLAVVVDDYLMKITHAFRGEEWLPSAPVHVLLWQYLGWEADMPQWAHLPLILKPDGHGKLSKRDGDRLGFPVFAMDWKDTATDELITGFKEKGFLPEALVNMLAMLGWNDGSEQELFTIEELTSRFSMDRVHKGGAKFDYEKAKWFNHQWIQKVPAESLLPAVKTLYENAGVTIGEPEKLLSIIQLIRERCILLSDFLEQGSFFFKAPDTVDTASIQPKWNSQKTAFFESFISHADTLNNWSAAPLEAAFKELAAAQNIKAGDVLLPFRVMLVGGKFGPAVFDIAAFIGKDKAVQRIRTTLQLLAGSSAA